MKFLNRKNSISKYIIALIMIVFCCYSIHNKKWKKLEIIQFDVYSYYTYLPATFIYHDLSLAFVDTLPNDNKARWWCESLKNGNKFLKMTSGVALLWSPFFLVANSFPDSSGTINYGFESKYQLAISLAALFYFLIGLIFLRKSLIYFFNDLTSSIVLLIIAFGTNLFYYTTFEPGMSHVYSFSLTAVFIYYSIQWNIRKYDYRHSVILGLLLGLIVLIRPINIFIALFPIIFQTDTIRIYEKFIALIKKPQVILVIAIAAIIPFIPQMIYWKKFCGSYLFYSYGQEHFHLDKPHVIDGLFGFRKGLFVYTPVMLCMLPGILISFFKNRSFFSAFLIITVPFVYLTFSWWCWWYGGTFGSRTLIDFYAIFAIAIGFFVEYLFQFKKVFILISVFICFLFYLNIFQSYQFDHKLLHYDSMTFKAYRKIFLKNKRPPDFNKYLYHPNIEQARRFGE